MKNILKAVVRAVIPKPIIDFAIRPAVWWILSVLFGKKGYEINIGGQGVFRMSPHFIFRGWEDFGNKTTSHFNQCIPACEGKSVFIDVGAHIGLYSLPASSLVRPGGQVFAFEPSGNSYGYLLKHIAYNNIDNIHPFQLIVGDTNKDSVLFYEHVISSSPRNGLMQRRKRASDRFVETERRQISLDHFCAENRLSPDIIKIDVGGAELLVLKGATTILTEHRPLMFLGVHPPDLAVIDQSTVELATMLHELGYEVRAPDGTRVEELGNLEYICTPTR